MNYSSELLASLQLEQRLHDDLYHPDIARLDIARRLSHLTLHLCKYCGDLMAAEGRGNAEREKKVLVDAAIISLSAATALQLDLFRLTEKDCLEDLPRAFVSRLVIRVGKLAKAAEALDHVEDYPVRKVWEAQFGRIFQEASIEIERRFGYPADLVRTRLQEVRSKVKFAPL